MPSTTIESLKIKAKLLQKAKRKHGQDIALKEAYSIIAKTAGYASWKEMKDDYEKADILNPAHWSAQWKVWFATKEEALAFFNTSLGYLVPYHNQFFVCDDNYVNALGIDEDDEDLQRVGRDWSDPKDSQAWKNLILKIQQHHSKN